MSQLEIERKFLLKALPDNIDAARSQEIQQGYIALTADSREVRVRRRGNQCYLTVKLGEGLTRVETEITISEEQFQALWPTTRHFQLTKVRHHLDYGGHTIEIDEYGGALAPLLIAEVEFDSVTQSQQFEPPQWFGRDITDDSRFSNYNLAASGLTEELLAETR